MATGSGDDRSWEIPWRPYALWVVIGLLAGWGWAAIGDLLVGEEADLLLLPVQAGIYVIGLVLTLVAAREVSGHHDHPLVALAGGAAVGVALFAVTQTAFLLVGSMVYEITLFEEVADAIVSDQLVSSLGGGAVGAFVGLAEALLESEGGLGGGQVSKGGLIGVRGLCQPKARTATCLYFSACSTSTATLSA